MADKKKGKKDDAENGEEDDNGESSAKPSEEPSARAGYIGLGLVGSLVVGFDPLRDAFQGNGSFEGAILRFLACAAVCVVGAGTIGRLLDAGRHTRPAVWPAHDTGPEPPGSEQKPEPGGQDRDQTISPGPATSGQSGRQESEPQP